MEAINDPDCKKTNNIFDFSKVQSFIFLFYFQKDPIETEHVRKVNTNSFHSYIG